MDRVWTGLHEAPAQRRVVTAGEGGAAAADGAGDGRSRLLDELLNQKGGRSPGARVLTGLAVPQKAKAFMGCVPYVFMSITAANLYCVHL